MTADSALLIPATHAGILTTMLAYLSPDWLAAAADAIAADTTLQGRTTTEGLVLEQIVEGPGATTDTTSWHVVFSAQGVEMVLGPAPKPDVTLRCDADTALRIHEGHESAQQAFMEGRLQLGGDPDTLLRHQDLLASLTDALAPLRPGGT